MENVSPASNDGVKMLGTHPENSHIPKHPWLEDEKSFWNDPRLFRGQSEISKKACIEKFISTSNLIHFAPFS